MNALSTVVFVDISGSAALYEAVGNARAAQAVTNVTQYIAEAVERHGGRVVKKLGDGVLGVFSDASSAMAAMAVLQREHKSRLNKWPEPLRMAVRVGIVSGEVLDVDGDCYGDAVNVASRLCERAGRSEIWATAATVLLAGAIPELWYRKLGKMEIRGKAEELVLYQVEWAEQEEQEHVTMQAGISSHFDALDAALGQIQLSWPGREMTFSSDDVPLQVGRATQAQLCIGDPRVSRIHARIEWRNGGFVLIDTSSFGTWVRFNDSQFPVRLRRDTCLLHGAGQIALGVAFTDPSAPIMNFNVSGDSVQLV